MSGAQITENGGSFLDKIKEVLNDEDKFLIRNFDNRLFEPEESDIFPNMDILSTFSQEEYHHELLASKRLDGLDFCSVNGKKLYELCVKQRKIERPG